MATSNVDNEFLITSYYLRHTDEAALFNPELLLNTTAKAILKGVKELTQQKLNFSLDTIHLLSKAHKEFEFSVLQDIFDNFTDFTNIEFHKKKLQSDWNKNVVIKGYVEDLIAKASNPDILTTSELLDVTAKIQRAIMTEASDAKLKSASMMAEEHKERIKERQEGAAKKTLGFACLDRQLTRAAAPKEITILAALRGSGKTALKQAMQRNLIRKRVPLLEFSVEMSEESNMDRYISTETKIDTKILNAKHLDDEVAERVLAALEEFKKYDNFLSTDESELNFDLVDSMLYQAKETFRQFGLLGKDQYLIYTIDLLDMLEDFEKGTPTDIRFAINKWHRLNKRHGSHGVGIVQLNENKIRGMDFENPDDVDKYRPNLEDIYGGSAYGQRARAVFVLDRPKFMKQRLFPHRIAEFDHELDLLHCHCVKHTDGDLFVQKFLFNGQQMKITPYNEDV